MNEWEEIWLENAPDWVKETKSIWLKEICLRVQKEIEAEVSYI